MWSKDKGMSSRQIRMSNGAVALTATLSSKNLKAYLIEVTLCVALVSRRCVSSVEQGGIRGNVEIISVSFLQRTFWYVHDARLLATSWQKAIAYMSVSAGSSLAPVVTAVIQSIKHTNHNVLDSGKVLLRIKFVSLVLLQPY